MHLYCLDLPVLDWLFLLGCVRSGLCCTQNRCEPFFVVVVVVVVVLLFFILFIFTCDFYLELGYRQIWKVKSIIILSASSLSGQVI